MSLFVMIKAFKSIRDFTPALHASLIAFPRQLGDPLGDVIECPVAV